MLARIVIVVVLMVMIFCRLSHFRRELQSRRDARLLLPWKTLGHILKPAQTNLGGGAFTDKPSATRQPTYFYLRIIDC
jgi:hypothetical protein